MNHLNRRLPETEFRRGGPADGKCMRKGCDNVVGPNRSNVFYCTDVCGRLANPDKFGDTREADLESLKPRRPCPTCGGAGSIVIKE